MRRILKYRLISLLMTAVPLLVAPACEHGDDGEGSAPEIVVKTNPVQSLGGSQFISVSASGAWTLSVECNPSGNWATVTPDTGYDDTDVVLNVDQNTETGSRTAQITLISHGWRKVITLTQRGAGSGDGGDDNGNGDGGNGGNGGNSGSTSGGNLKQTGWLELPALTTPQGSSTYDFFYHNMTVGSKTVRNYSFSWDYDNLVAPWVAYPLNRGLLNKAVDRSDEWGLDPLLPESKQPVLIKGFSEGGYDRGHQIPSADRLLSYNANVQTFYGTNMTPQIGKNFNQSIWANLETIVRSWANQSDTLYVVTGCVTEGSTKYATDNKGKKVTVPTAYYKALLRYSKASTIGKSGYVACAMWLDHKNYSSQVISSSYSMSIDKLEEKLGIDLFVNLPSAVGETVAAAIEAEDPKTQQWWWQNMQN
ncbi:MAG: DNA/RNA non-specific endonuclease [Bacteroidales bacterium]|nr:DNA/RNA non-specific endonuclease [Bacteroidales bacterium]